MALAERRALDAESDYILWFNDDAILCSSALSDLMRIASTRQDAIIIGALADPRTAAITYSGYVSRGPWRPIPPRLVEPKGFPTVVDTLNGNVVLVPRAVAIQLGGIDDTFEHGFADLDYGLRAAKLGIATILAPSPIGTCPRNHPTGTWQDPKLPIRKRICGLLSPKGVPPRSLVHFVRRHSGWRWPIVTSWIYLRIFQRIARRR